MVRQIVMGVLITGLLGGVASAQVAMLTQVTGDVKVSPKDGAAARAALPFQKLNDGEKLALAANARVQVVFLATGRQEVWKGAGPVDIGATEGRSASLKPETSQVPAVILRQLQKTPAVGQTGKTGMVTLRSIDNLDAIDTLEKDYHAFRARVPADDTTPEVFFLTGLIEFQDYDRAAKLIEELKIKLATQPAYGPVIEHFSSLLAAAKKGPRG